MQTTNAFPQLQGQQFMSLTTFRKNGEAVPTPVWFAQVDDKLYVFTDPDAGKVKRIRHTPRVTVAPCTMSGEVTGETQEATARILNETESRAALDAINDKYTWQKRSLDIMNNIVRMFRRSEAQGAVYLEITPA